jgi:hypothetical protein
VQELALQELASLCSRANLVMCSLRLSTGDTAQLRCASQ